MSTPFNSKVCENRMNQKNYRIADIAVTLAEMFGLELRSTTVGTNRTNDLN